MAFIGELLRWYNLIFVSPMCLTAFYIFFQLFGLAGMGSEAEVDADVDVDADVSVDVDVDMDVDADVSVEVDVDADAHVDVDADVSADVDADADADTEQDVSSSLNRASFLLHTLSFVGVGKVPLSVLLEILLLTWGFFGWMTNSVLANYIPPFTYVPLLHFPVALGVATILSLLVTKTIAGTVAKLLPSTVTQISKKQDFVGATATVISGEVTEKFGIAHLRDKHGDLHKLYCRLRPGKEIIKKGEPVMLIAYDKKKKEYIVQKSPLQLTG